MVPSETEAAVLLFNNERDGMLTKRMKGNI